MAVVKSQWLDPNGVQTMAELIYKSVNSRIKERISTAITEGSYSDADHVLSAEAILGLVGSSSDVASDGTLYGYVNDQVSTLSGQISGLEDAIGDDEDVAADGTVYGYINGQVSTINAAIGDDQDVASDGTVYGYINGVDTALRQLIGGLTHLNFQVVTGDIETEVPAQDAREDVIYLQHDEPTYSMGTDNYFLNAQGTHAQYTDESGAEPVTYEAWYDASDNKIYKMVGGVKGAEITTDDPIFENVALIEDTTYNLYIWHRTSAEGVTPVTHEWLCVGDTSLELDNYWSKNDNDVNTLKNLIMEAISAQTITQKVRAAFDNTDPYQPNDGGYLDDWMPSDGD